MFGIIESDFFSPQSQTRRIRKYTTTEIREKLKIDGYLIEIPSTWDNHGQARLICYVSDDIKYKRKHIQDNINQTKLVDSKEVAEVWNLKKR